MARIVAKFIDVRRELFGEAIVLLQIDNEIRFGLLADFGDGVGFGRVVDGDADDVGTGIDQSVRLADRGVDIAGLCGRHTLDGDWATAADGDRANANGASRVARYVCHRILCPQMDADLTQMN